MNRDNPLISVVVAAYNEGKSLPELYRQLISIFHSRDVELEILVIDDGSNDGTLDWLRSTSQIDQRVRYLSFSRNFGHQAALTAGLRNAVGDAVIVMDADLQDPPQVIPEMLQKWREGYQVVRGTRIERESDPWSKRLFAWFYYRLLRRLAKVNMPVDSGDFCLLDRLVVDSLNSLPERNRYVRGLRAWIGFRQVDQPFNRQQRFSGTPKYSLLKSLALALDGLVSFSYTPLRLATYLGLISGALALVMVALVFYWRFFTDSPLVGSFAIIAAFLVFGSVQLMTIGIMGEYIGRIYDEVKGRPHYVVKESSLNQSFQTPVSIPFVDTAMREH
jgi:glycosyltransferase involved in cell wall biosynthesis